MGHNNSVFNQLQQFLPNYEFNKIVSKYEADRYIKTFTCKNQLNLMMYAQLTKKESLRDIESALKIHSNKLYHLGIKAISKSSLSRINTFRANGHIAPLQRSTQYFQILNKTPLPKIYKII